MSPPPKKKKGVNILCICAFYDASVTTNRINRLLPSSRQGIEINITKENKMRTLLHLVYLYPKTLHLYIWTSIQRKTAEH